MQENGEAMKLWISCAAGPAREPWGTIAVVAETRDEAIAKAPPAPRGDECWPECRGCEIQTALLDNLGSMMESALGDVLIDLDPFTVDRSAWAQRAHQSRIGLVPRSCQNGRKTVATSGY